MFIWRCKECLVLHMIVKEHHTLALRVVLREAIERTDFITKHSRSSGARSNTIARQAFMKKDTHRIHQSR